jgi:serine/threonine protein kinase
VAILGLPTAKELKSMSKQMTEDTIKLVHKLDEIPKRNFQEILPNKDYMSAKELEQAADLLENLLRWDPNQRYSCEQALKHAFFKGL